MITRCDNKFPSKIIGLSISTHYLSDSSIITPKTAVSERYEINNFYTDVLIPSMINA